MAQNVPPRLLETPGTRSWCFGLTLRKFWPSWPPGGFTRTVGFVDWGQKGVEKGIWGVETAPNDPLGEAAPIFWALSSRRLEQVVKVLPEEPSWRGGPIFFAPSSRRPEQVVKLLPRGTLSERRA